MSLPKEAREVIRQRLWTMAEREHWERMTNAQKASMYDQWTEDPQIGGVLVRYIDKSQVRVYIKDTLLKEFSRQTLSSTQRPFFALGVDPTVQCVEQFIKPHGVAFSDGRIVCWGRADDWRQVLLAVFERAFKREGCDAYGAVFLRSRGRHDKVHRGMVTEAARRLGVTVVAWLED